MVDTDNSVRMDINNVETRQSSMRQTPNTSFGAQFRSGLNATVNTVGSTASAAGYNIPGAAVVGAAITSLGNVRDTPVNLSATAPNATGLTANVSTSGVGGGVSSGTVDGVVPVSGSSSGSLGSSGTGSTGTSSSSQLLAATQQMEEMNQTFNLQYLILQENTQKDTREYTCMSNVIKGKSDTAKNTLSNLR